MSGCPRLDREAYCGCTRKRHTIRTTVDLDERRLRELMHLLGVKTKREALHRAMDECIRRGRIGELLALEGKVKFAAGWREMEVPGLRRHGV